MHNILENLLKREKVDTWSCSNTSDAYFRVHVAWFLQWDWNLRTLYFFFTKRVWWSLLSKRSRVSDYSTKELSCWRLSCFFTNTSGLCIFSNGISLLALAPFHISLKGKVFTATISLVSHNHGISRSLGVATTRCRFDFLAVATSYKILEC